MLVCSSIPSSFRHLSARWHVHPPSLYIHQQIHSSIHSSTHSSKYHLLNYQPICLCNHLLINLFIYLSINLFVHLSTYSSIYLRIHPLTCPPISPLIQQQQPSIQMIASHLLHIPRALSRTQPPCAAPGRQFCHHRFLTHCLNLLLPSYCSVLLAQQGVPSFKHR